MPRSYETMLIVRPDVVEDSLEQFLNSQKQILQDNGVSSVETQIKGKRRFSGFEMGRFKEGLYVLMHYEADPEAVAVWEKGLRIHESVLRFMTLRQEEE